MQATFCGHYVIQSANNPLNLMNLDTPPTSLVGREKSVYLVIIINLKFTLSRLAALLDLDVTYPPRCQNSIFCPCLSGFKQNGSSCKYDHQKYRELDLRMLVQLHRLCIGVRSQCLYSPLDSLSCFFIHTG